MPFVIFVPFVAFLWQPLHVAQIAIIGGGIGGLTAAIALRQSGFEAEVFEQAPALLDVGAAIAIWPNAMRVLEVPVQARQRLSGRTSLTPVRVAAAAARVLLAMVIVPLRPTVQPPGD